MCLIFFSRLAFCSFRKCVLYARLEPKTAAMHAYLKDTCHCRPKGEEGIHKDVQNMHYDGRRRSTMSDLDPRVLEQIAAATTTDTAIFKTALVEFMNEIHWLEQFKLGRRVMCDAPLDKWQDEMTYLGVDLKALYYNRAFDEHAGTEEGSV